jgi:tetratricopeptide (TPR) repeat protein
LAWKMLEIARVMYEDLGSAPLELADVLETVGELNMEQSQFDAAVKDYGSALALLEANLDATDRRLASALYSMSMAHQMLEANDDALAATSRAVRICEARAAELKAGTALVSKGARENAGQPLSPEATIAELEEIMAVASDLKEREEELKELVSADNSTREALRAAFKAIGGAAPEPASAPEESTGFAAPKLQSSLPVQAAPVRKVVPAPVRKVEVAPLREAPVKRAEPQQTAPAAPAQPEAKKLKPTPAETPTEAPKDAEPNGCAQQ